MNVFEQIDINNNELLKLITEWENKLLNLPAEVIKERRNSQKRTVKQIVGHMVDSAANNTHRMVFMQHRKSPFKYPNYAIHGNNDKWIAIQDYQNEDWQNLVKLWKYSNLHWVHVAGIVDPGKLGNLWDFGEDKLLSLEEMIIDYPRHFKLHLEEINELLNT
ncbi:MAG: DinB family protein [Bacteroidales bacterium]|nr:DinB family protein [Bacteroidales bacterium]